MSKQRANNELSDVEWRELNAMYQNMRGYLACYSTGELERFSDMFARSIAGKGNPSGDN